VDTGLCALKLCLLGRKISEGGVEPLVVADDAERERHRQDLAEPFWTLLGHFRHEVGHYYWDRCVRGGVWLESFRDLFGDERQYYQARLQTHYAMGPRPDWQQNFVSSRVRPRAGRDPALNVTVDFDPYRETDFNILVRAWLPLTYAVNSLNHSVGQPDLYPFVLAPTVMGKLRFIHGLVHQVKLPGSATSPMIAV
jgi:hypothetical protein